MEGSLRRIDAPVGVAALFSLLIPLIQISLNVLAKSGLIPGHSATQQTGIGVLYNLPDSLSYASWASQAKLGYVTFVDLFTTEAHSSALFNLYFLIVGFLSRVIGTDPLSVMEISSLLLGPVSVFAILLIARELRFDGSAQALSLVFVLLGSGLSGLMIMLETLGLQLLHPGADAYYLDLFPLTSLVFYPYHAATFVLLALIVLVSIRIFAASNGPVPAGRATLLGALFLITGLVRPYEAVTLALVFNLTALFGIVANRGANLRQTLATCFIVDFLAFPPVAYAAFMATRPVWGAFAENSMAFSTGGPAFFLKGFVILWGLAGVGLVFAIADRKRALCFVACWAIVGAALLCFSPSYGTKFAGGSVLPNGLLAAYGIRRLLQESATPGRRRAIRQFVVCAIGVMSLTPIVAFADILQVGAPQIDTELLAAGKRIRDLEGTRLPVVLAEPNAGAVLAGLFGERVYAGHWSLTPDFRKKTELLKQAGIEASSPAGTGYDRGVLADLVRDTRAAYVLLRRTAPAAQAIGICTRSKPAFDGERWIAINVSGWSCP
jgi:hypothetical protein